MTLTRFGPSGRHRKPAASDVSGAGVNYAREIRCFDETGYPDWPDFAAVYLQEDIDGGNIPPVPPDYADPAGTIWI
jgi:hypothetical protein